MLDFASFMMNEVNEEDLNDIKSMTPKEYYEMSASSRFLMHVKIINLQYQGHLRVSEELSRLDFFEHKYIWQATKDDERLLFADRKEIQRHFDIKVAYQGECQGYIFKKVNVTRVTDIDGNLLDEKIGKVY